VNQHLNAADIYVSTNLYGNLSNANLEALSAGASLLLPTSAPSLPLDTVTDRLIPADVAARYDRASMPASLADTLERLLRNPEEIARRRERTAILARQLVRPWSEVVESDIALLKSVAAPAPSCAAPAPIKQAGNR
jgi:glycosyltransferase involved in cell wall biosynthesis